MLLILFRSVCTFCTVNLNLSCSTIQMLMNVLKRISCVQPNSWNGVRVLEGMLHVHLYSTCDLKSYVELD